MTGEPDLSRSLAVDYREAELSEADRAMLDYVVELTRQPYGSDRHVDRLREVGFDDRAILDICQIAAYYNYVNRLADGLGVELEPTWASEELTLTEEEFHRMRTERSK